MILFIFEGEREPKLFDSIKELFFPKEVDSFECVYGCNIYHLYSSIKKYDIFGDSTSVDTISILNEILLQKRDNTLSNINVADISEIFLFFDYDFHHHPFEELEEDNHHIKVLLDFFNEETENGKLYINYPMIESIRYTKILPDNEYVNYAVTRDECCDFKRLSSAFSAYDSLNHLCLSNNKNESEVKKQICFDNAKKNWRYLIDMNVTKANYLCNNKKHSFPALKSEISQICIFEAQLQKYVNCEICKVSILNSFPIFLYDYLKEV